MKKGKFIISLDFELHWGAVEKWDVLETQDKFIATRSAVKQTLNLFSKYDVHATWATVGFLFAKNRADIDACMPEVFPEYKQFELSSYNVIKNDELGQGESDDKSHYAATLLELINQTANQEIASHTFSHYYALEEGQDITSFEQDIKSAQMIANKNGFHVKSLVFPRNQYNSEYLSVLSKHGINCVRSNPDNWIWSANRFDKVLLIKLMKKLGRGLDLILPLSNTIYPLDGIKGGEDGKPVCIPSSRFLRPYKSKEGFLNVLKLWRIKNEMTRSAISGKAFHLWWHPHNFSEETGDNLKYLEKILKHYCFLREKYSYSSENMAEICRQVLECGDN